MTSCQISLAAMRLFSRISRTVFLLFSQNKKSEVKVLLKKVYMRSSVEGRKSQPYVACYIKSSINLLLFCRRYRVGLPNLHAMFVEEINYKHFPDSQTGSSGTYKRTLVEGKEELNFKDLQ